MPLILFTFIRGFQSELTIKSFFSLLLTLNIPPSSHFDTVTLPRPRHHSIYTLYDQVDSSIRCNSLSTLTHYLWLTSTSVSIAKMVAMKGETTESSLVNDKTVKDDSGAIEKSVIADSTTKREGQAAGEDDQVAMKPKAEGEDAGKSDGAEEKPKAVIEAAETKDKAVFDGSKNAAAHGQGGASSQRRDAGDRRSGYKRGGHQGNRKFEDYRKNVKTDFTAQKESEDPVEIRKQVKAEPESIRYLSANII